MPDLRGPDRQPAFLGIPTYIHSPLALSQEELAEMQADVAVIGAPVDMGVVNRPGARFGPRAIRQAGYSGSPNDTFYHMEYELYPTQEIKVVDFGDANCPPSSLEQSHEAVRLKTMQALAGGRDSACAGRRPLDNAARGDGGGAASRLRQGGHDSLRRACGHG